MQKILISFVAALLLSGCAHKIDVQQGNVVSQEQLAKLQPGMTPTQVRYALGEPLVTDPFHQQRWDYVYRMKLGDGSVQNYRVTIHFNDAQVVERIEKHGELPATDYEAGQQFKGRANF